jgi:fumarate reductase subunit C
MKSPLTPHIIRGGIARACRPIGGYGGGLTLSLGPEAYAAFQQWLKMPHIIVLNGISLLFVLFHTVTWFNLAPRAMAVRLRGKRVPDLLIAGSNYFAWLVVSVAVAWLILRG